ncbi:MAG TPA: hypothetical protein PK263_07100 [bacterium]|nr:hypothetical protein [bacterium]
MNPLEASIEHLSATLFHQFPQSGKGYVVEKEKSKKRITKSKKNHK